jgi:hypothetical protein
MYLLLNYFIKFYTAYVLCQFKLKYKIYILYILLINYKLLSYLYLYFFN